MNRMSVDEKVQQVIVARCYNFQIQHGKEYKKSSLSKDRCLIKKDVDSKNLSWEYVKNILYFIRAVDLEKLEKNKSLEIEVSRLQERYESREVVLKVEKINMRDTIKKKYEKEFEDKYCIGMIAELKMENERLKKNLFDDRAFYQQERSKEESNELSELQTKNFKIAELSLENHELKLTQKTSNKCKKCRIHKKKILSLESKLLDYESSDDEASSSGASSEDL